MKSLYEIFHGDVRKELKYHRENAPGRAFCVYVQVYRGSATGDSTNGGASSRFNRLYVYSEIISPEAARLDATECGVEIEKCFRVGHIDYQGKRFFHVKPLDPKLAGKWTMNGGNFVYTCDGRWEEVTNCDYPLPVHDRIEE